MGTPPKLALFPVDAGLPGAQPAKAESTRTFWRYYFAGQALAGFSGNVKTKSSISILTAESVRVADALLAKLESEEAKP